MKRKDFSKVLMGVVLGLLTIMVGELGGMGIGIFEDNIKHSFTISAMAHNSSYVIAEDLEKTPSQTADKGFKYIRRGHMHAMGLGVITMVFAVILYISNIPVKIAKKLSICVGIGGLGYPCLLIIAGILMPLYGIHGAKEILKLPVFLTVGLHIASIVYGGFLLLICQYTQKTFESNAVKDILLNEEL